MNRVLAAYLGGVQRKKETEQQAEAKALAQEKYDRAVKIEDEDRKLRHTKEDLDAKVGQLNLSRQLGEEYSKSGVTPTGYKEKQRPMQEAAPGEFFQYMTFEPEESMAGLPSFSSFEPAGKVAQERYRNEQINAPKNEQAIALEKERQAGREALLEARNEAAINQIDERYQMMKEIQNIKDETSLELQRLRGTQGVNLQDMRGNQAQDLQELRGTQAQDLQGIKRDQAITLQDIKGDQALDQIAARNEAKIAAALKETGLKATAIQVKTLAANDKVEAMAKEAIKALQAYGFDKYFRGPLAGGALNIVQGTPLDRRTNAERLTEANIKNLLGQIILQQKEVENLGATLTPSERGALTAFSPAPEFSVIPEEGITNLNNIIDTAARNRKALLSYISGIKKETATTTTTTTPTKPIESFETK